MLRSAQRKTGRPTASYRTSWGERIEGITRLADGRWKISGPPILKFTEPDERLAIVRFRNISRPAIDIRSILSTPEEAIETFAGRVRGAVRGEVNIDIPLHRDEQYGVSNFQPQANVWAWMREQILTRPAYVAQMTGIEQIGYLADIERPGKSAKLESLIEIYASKPGISTEEITRVKRIWNEFRKIIGIATLRELTHEQVERYEKAIGESSLGPKSTKHRYGRVKTVIAYAMKRGQHAKDCRQALDRLAMLEVDTTDSLNPDPITPAQFWKIHAAAVDAGNIVFAAMMLFSLNCALYPSEAGVVRWADIDLDRGEFVTRRRKTKVPRVAILWPETIKVLRKFSHDRETVFNTRRQAYARFSVFRDWCIYKKAANLENVTYAQIRDASFTTACRLSLDQARVLAGHRLPGAVDNYVLRQPRFVADVCEAIRDEFYGMMMPLS